MEALEFAEDNIVELKKPFARKSFYIQPLRQWKKIQEELSQPEALIQLVELFFNTASDYELYKEIVKGMCNLPLGYPGGFTREIAWSAFEEIKKNNPQMLYVYGTALLNKWIEMSRDVSFVIDNGELKGFIAFIEDEPQHSGYIEVSVRGSQQDKVQAALSIDNFFRMIYLKHWYDKGYRYIWANAFTPKGKEFINHVGRKESETHVFNKRDQNKTVRYNGKYHWLMNARWDLFRKFGRPSTK